MGLLRSMLRWVPMFHRMANLSSDSRTKLRGKLHRFGPCILDA
jgi:hypothetical protein